MEAKIKTFDQLTNKEVYEILKARFKVFVMEQETLYLDMDDVDYVVGIPQAIINMAKHDSSYH